MNWYKIAKLQEEDPIEVVLLFAYNHQNNEDYPSQMIVDAFKKIPTDLQKLFSYDGKSPIYRGTLTKHLFNDKNNTGQEFRETASFSHSKTTAEQLPRQLSDDDYFEKHGIILDNSNIKSYEIALDFEKIEDWINKKDTPSKYKRYSLEEMDESEVLLINCILQIDKSILMCECGNGKSKKPQLIPYAPFTSKQVNDVFEDLMCNDCAMKKAKEMYNGTIYQKPLEMLQNEVSFVEDEYSNLTALISEKLIGNLNTEETDSFYRQIGNGGQQLDWYVAAYYFANGGLNQLKQDLQNQMLKIN